MDAIEYFQRQNQRLDELFDRLAHAHVLSDKEELLARLARAVRLHDLLTERFLFPALQHHIEDRSALLEAHEEHRLIAWAMRSLLTTHPRDARHEPLARVFERLVRDHYAREEELLLPRRRLLNRTELSGIGRQIEADERVERAADSVPPPPAEPPAARETAHEAIHAAPTRRSRWGLKRPDGASLRRRARPTGAGR